MNTVCLSTQGQQVSFFKDPCHPCYIIITFITNKSLDRSVEKNNRDNLETYLLNQPIGKFVAQPDHGIG